MENKSRSDKNDASSSTGGKIMTPAKRRSPVMRRSPAMMKLIEMCLGGGNGVVGKEAQ